MKAMVIGAAGLLGRALCREFGTNGRVIPVTHDELDIRDRVAVDRFIGRARADVVINAAAFADVDGCESNPDQAFSVNAFGAGNVARASLGTAGKHVYVSTDYVFDGAKGIPYTESDRPAPLSTYGRSKLAGEQEVERSNPHAFIVRTAWLYGEGDVGLVHAVLTAARNGRDLSASSDQWGTPTWVDDLALQVRALVRSDAFGLYHASSEGSTTRYGFACELLRCAGYVQCSDDATRFASRSDRTHSFAVRSARTEERSRPAKRPRYAVLENQALKQLNLNLMPNWRDSLQRFIGRTGESRGGVR